MIFLQFKKITGGQLEELEESQRNGLQLLFLTGGDENQVKSMSYTLKNLQPPVVLSALLGGGRSKLEDWSQPEERKRT